mmetsp:Transcript_7117/g.23396  ORF Transcript_7117/g.23396 Transcript_7117/m.23396 type:complete len:299 (+) Transcript_7117:1472-2368(+)
MHGAPMAAPGHVPSRRVAGLGRPFPRRKHSQRASTEPLPCRQRHVGHRVPFAELHTQRPVDGRVRVHHSPLCGRLDVPVLRAVHPLICQHAGAARREALVVERALAPMHVAADRCAQLAAVRARQLPGPLQRGAHVGQLACGRLRHLGRPRQAVQVRPAAGLHVEHAVASAAVGRLPAQTTGHMRREDRAAASLARCAPTPSSHDPVLAGGRGAVAHGRNSSSLSDSRLVDVDTGRAGLLVIAGGRRGARRRHRRAIARVQRQGRARKRACRGRSGDALWLANGGVECANGKRWRDGA